MNDPYSSQTKEELAYKQHEAKELQGLLFGLERHPGWIRFQEWIEQSLESAEFGLFKEENPHVAYRLVGNVAAFKSVKLWLDAERREIDEVLQQDKI